MLSDLLKTCHFQTVGLALILNNIHVVIAVAMKYFFHYQQVVTMKSVILFKICVHVLFQGWFFQHSSNYAYFGVNKISFIYVSVD